MFFYVTQDEEKLTNDEIGRFSRQIILPDFRVKSQLKLKVGTYNPKQNKRFFKILQSSYCWLHVQALSFFDCHLTVNVHLISLSDILSIQKLFCVKKGYLLCIIKPFILKMFFSRIVECLWLGVVVLDVPRLFFLQVGIRFVCAFSQRTLQAFTPSLSFLISK